jgi:oligopeptide transport system substrate-binding protein
MRKVKWIFFGYLAVVGVLVLGIALSFATVSKRDPDTLYIVYISDIKSLDPAEISDVPSSRIAGNLFECLYNYDYYKRPYELICELATALPEISKDGLQYTVHLRKGIHFYDPDGAVWPGKTGPEVKAKNFIYAWKRVLDFHLPNPNAANFDSVVGADEWAKYTEDTKDESKIDWDRPLEGFQAIDDYTIRIKLKEPFPQLVYALAHLPSAPMSKDVIDKYKKKTRQHPVGTGPYSLSYNDHLQQQRILLKRNPIYRGGPMVDPAKPVADKDRLPRMDRIQFEFFEEELPPWYVFREGLFDYHGIPKDAYGQAIRTGTELTPELVKQGVTLIKEPEPSIYYYGFNMQDPLVGKNKPLRQAMCMALNRDEFIATFRNGRGLKPIGPIVPGFPTYDPNARNPYAEFNLDAARAKMKEAVAANGGEPIPTIKLLLPGSDTVFRQMGDYVQRNMAQIGVTLDVDYTNWANFLEQVEKKKTAQFYQLGWNTDWPDEQNILQLFWSKNISEGGLNSSNYNNPEFDKLYEQAKIMSDSPQRRELYKKMQDIVNEDCPWMLLYYPMDFALQHRWVKNLKLVDYVHGWMANVEIDKALRKQGLPKG